MTDELNVKIVLRVAAKKINVYTHGTATTTTMTTKSWDREDASKSAGLSRFTPEIRIYIWVPCAFVYDFYRLISLI